VARAAVRVRWCVCECGVDNEGTYDDGEVARGGVEVEEVDGLLLEVAELPVGPLEPMVGVAPVVRRVDLEIRQPARTFRTC
jgi:hypothetical protein